MGEKGKRLCNKQYEEIKLAVVSLYEMYDIHCTPVSGFEIATKMGAKLKAETLFHISYRRSGFHPCKMSQWLLMESKWCKLYCLQR